MDDIIAHLEQSIADELLTKPEKKTLKALVAESLPDQDQLNFLRSKIYELADKNVSDRNYRFIMEWVRMASNALQTPPRESRGSSVAYFSPGDSCRDAIIQQISRAVRKLNICVFTVSDDRITEAISLSHRKGVEIKLLTDNDKALDLGSDILQLAREGVIIKMDNTANHMHHKFMVADDRTLLTGSYNWTRSAARFNHENILVTEDAGLVKSFVKEFERLWSEMSLYQM